jgi:hypothetical protein
MRLPALLSILFTAGVVASCTTNAGTNGFDAGDDGSTTDTDAATTDDGSQSFGDTGAGKDAGGTLHGCDGSCALAGGTCKGDVCVLHENPGMVDSSTRAKLKAGGKDDAAFRWTYPYDRTVFPLGLLPPTLQFGGTAADAAYVHITTSVLDYEGYFAPGASELALSKASWSAVTNAAGPKDPLAVQVTKISSGRVTGPISESWPVAHASLRGTIYYETYGSSIISGGGGMGQGGVGIMKVKPGDSQPTVVKEGCGNVCHSASANGSTLVANTSPMGGSAAYDLTQGASTINSAQDTRYTYGALYPDGSMFMSATGYRLWAGLPSQLYGTKSGQVIATNGWSIQHGGTPAFAPDGKEIAFVHEDVDGHTLAKMSFDAATKTFSKLVDVATSTDFVAWPAFTPDDKWIVYQAGSSQSFETDSGSSGDVFFVDAATKAIHRLDSLDGYTGGGGGSYLPADDPGLSFAPTVLPEAVGGYFWVVFTSHRSYGNTLPSKDNNDENGKLWVAAVDLKPSDGKDPSHPAFFLDGQEKVSDNLRGFWVQSPCMKNGSSCQSGDQCCDGFCRGGDGGAAVCVPPPGGCSNEYEKCSTNADCCDPTYECIGGKCSQPSVQ